MEVSLSYSIGDNGLKETGKEEKKNKLESVLWTGEAEELDVCIDDFESL